MYRALWGLANQGPFSRVTNPDHFGADPVPKIEMNVDPASQIQSIVYPDHLKSAYQDSVRLYSDNTRLTGQLHHPPFQTLGQW